MSLTATWIDVAVVAVAAVAVRPGASANASVVAYGVLVLFDWPAWEGTGGVGLRNLLTAVVVPAVLFWRHGADVFAQLLRDSAVVRWWLALIAFAAVATLWSDYRLPALKLAGYLGCYTAMAAVYLRAAHDLSLIHI